ncbi:MAG TPA: nucleotidyltransferase domain-containing protein [Candidatus Limnocylindrales bacterium]
MLGERRREIIDLAASHHASNVRLFGSVARHDETDRSDVDLLVDMEPNRSLLDQVRLRRALSELLGVQVDLLTSGGLLERDSAILEGATPI